MKDHPLFKGYALVLFSVFVWAGWTVASRMAVKGTLSPYDVTAIRFTIAGLLLLPVIVRRGLNVGPWGWKSAFLLSILIGAPYTNIAVAGMLFAPASHASTVITGTLLVFTTLVGIYYLREETTRVRLVGVACSVAGIVCMLAAKSIYGTSQEWLGHVFFVTAGLIWGGYTLLVRAWRLDAFHAAAAVCVFSMVTYMPIYLLFIPSHIGLGNWREVAFQSAYQGVLTGTIALITFNKGIHLIGASRAGALVPLVPVLSTLLAVPILGEVPTPLEWTGVATVSFGVLLASGVLHWRFSRAASATPLP